MKIMRVSGREVYDSRGWPTLLCELLLEDGTVFTGYAPSGNSRSKYEAHEIRDNDKRLWGKGVRSAIEVLEALIAPLLVGQNIQMPELDFALIELDGTPNKSRLGGNVLTATSIALYKAFAYTEELQLYELFAHLIGSESVTLPCPIFSIITSPTGAADRAIIQEFMIAPLGATTLKHAIDISFALYHEIKDLLRGKGKLVGTNEEGGFTVIFNDEREILDIIVQSFEKAPLEDAGSCAVAIHIAATELYDPIQQRYILKGQPYRAAELVNLYNELIQTYPIYSIEDGLSEDDWEGWQLITETIGDKIQIVGDALFATNPERVSRALEANVATAAIIKPNQIGTITETIQLINLCKAYRLNAIIAHRSGETEDPFISDLAVGTSIGQIKAGGCSRIECVAKYNRLLAIEETLMLNRTKL